MCGSRGYIVPILLAVLALAGCKPDWWPDKGPTGMEWPPPQPQGWEGDWPPNDDNPEWWVKHFRNRNDGGGTGNDRDPDNVGGEGFAGHQKFSVAFQDIYDPQRPACGLFRMLRIKAVEIEACTPFPQQTVQDACGTVRDADTAKTECEAQCATRPRCREGRLYRPEMRAQWGCLTPIAPDSTTVRIEAYCQAIFLCECLERD